MFYQIEMEKLYLNIRHTTAYTNKSYFYNEFFKKYQLSPKQYKGMKAESEE